MKKLNFAILGCGRISLKHVEAIASNYRDCNLVAICDLIPEKMETALNEYFSVLEKLKSDLKVEKSEKKDIKQYTNYIEMIEKEKIDVVAIATESGYHAEQAIICMNRGKHVIVEKPMALSTKDAEDMIKAAEDNKVKLAVCHQNRFNPPIQKLRKAIEEGRFGKLVNGTARILWNRSDSYYKQAAWRGTWEMDGGTLMNQCIHNIDLLQWMMGGEVASVYAQTGNFLRNIEAEDFGAIIIRFKNGTIGIVEGSACVYPKNLEETLSIFGEKGTAVIGGLAVNKIETWDFSDEVNHEEATSFKQEIDSVYGFGHIPLFKDFIDAIREERAPLIDGKEGKKAMGIILGAYKSQLTGMEVNQEGLQFSTIEAKEFCRGQQNKIYQERRWTVV